MVHLFRGGFPGRSGFLIGSDFPLALASRLTHPFGRPGEFWFDTGALEHHHDLPESYLALLKCLVEKKKPTEVPVVLFVNRIRARSSYRLSNSSRPGISTSRAIPCYTPRTFFQASALAIARFGAIELLSENGASWSTRSS